MMYSRIAPYRRSWLHLRDKSIAAAAGGQCTLLSHQLRVQRGVCLMHVTAVLVHASTCFTAAGPSTTITCGT